MTEYIFHNHNGIIHQHTQGKNKTEQDNHIQGISEQADDHKRNQHRQGDGNTY